MATPEELKGTCVECGGRLQFLPEARGTEIDCPHCGASTKLEVAATGEEQEGDQPMDALKSGIAGFAKAASLTARKATEKAKAHGVNHTTIQMDGIDGELGEPCKSAIVSPMAR